jgi:hypothetical protein
MNATTRPVHVLTPEEAERFDRLAEVVEAEKSDIIRQAKRLMAAGDEPGFNGDLRRAIHGSGVVLEKIANAAGMHVFALCDFLEGTAELTSGQIAAIAQFLGLQLVRTIPAAGMRAPAGSQRHSGG